MALIGEHQINFRVPKNSKLDQLNLNFEFRFNETEYCIEKKFGTDKWILNVGKVLSKMINESNNTKPDKNSIVEITNLNVTSFKKGLMQWSTHKIKIQFKYELIKQGAKIREGTVEGFGTGSGTEFGILTFIPILGNMNFDKGIELALYRSLELGLMRLNKEVKPSITINKKH